MIDTLADHGQRISSPVTVFSIYQLGGAVARTGEDEAAFTGRDAGHLLNIIGITRTGEGSMPSASGRAACGRRSSRTTRTFT